MTIVANSVQFKTLADRIIANNVVVQEVYANGVKVYPDGDPGQYDTVVNPWPGRHSAYTPGNSYRLSDMQFRYVDQEPYAKRFPITVDAEWWQQFIDFAGDNGIVVLTKGFVYTGSDGVAYMGTFQINAYDNAQLIGFNPEPIPGTSIAAKGIIQISIPAGTRELGNEWRWIYVIDPPDSEEGFKDLIVLSKENAYNPSPYLITLDTARITQTSGTGYALYDGTGKEIDVPIAGSN